ncbi:hypothetical protein F4823DRAFT_298165 [Ustulina deusta]|nr:hypothetical protein F4823DRAFT_298165 [Ustulina deusta]
MLYTPATFVAFCPFSHQTPDSDSPLGWYFNTLDPLPFSVCFAFLSSPPISYIVVRNRLSTYRRSCVLRIWGTPPSKALVYLTFSFIGCRPFPRTLYLCLTACAAVVCGLRSAPRVIATAYLELLSYILGELLQSYRRCIHSIRFAREASVLTPAPIVVIAQLEQLGGEVEYRELHHRTSATPLQSPLPSPLPIPRLSRTTKLFQYPTSVFLHEPTKLRRSIQYFQDFLSAKPHTTAFYLSIYRLQLSILLFLITLHSRRPK